MSTDSTPSAFNRLLPEDIISSLTGCGWHCDGHIQALASYENRVYQIGLADHSYVVAKFYRPERWTDEQILEEFDFTDTLYELDLPVLTPMTSPDGQVLCRYKGFRFSVYPKAPGHAPYLDNVDQLEQIGRLLGRIHNGGFQHTFDTRETFSFEQRALQSAQFVFDNGWVPDDLKEAYMSIAEPVLEHLDNSTHEIGLNDNGRIHGDMHVGNLLWSDEGPIVLDFDDACNGPQMQDLWMFLSGDRDEMQHNLEALATGYEMFRTFPAHELGLVESLRTMRMMHHTAWLARRWSDPAFPRAFPWFNQQKFWQDHILGLKEQLALLQEPALVLAR